MASPPAVIQQLSKKKYVWILKYDVLQYIYIYIMRSRSPQATSPWPLSISHAQFMCLSLPINIYHATVVTWLPFCHILKWCVLSRQSTLEFDTPSPLSLMRTLRKCISDSMIVDHPDGTRPSRWNWSKPQKGDLATSLSTPGGCYDWLPWVPCPSSLGEMCASEPPLTIVKADIKKRYMYDYVCIYHISWYCVIWMTRRIYTLSL